MTTTPASRDRDAPSGIDLGATLGHLRRLLAAARPYWPRLAGGVLLGLLVGGLGVAIPYVAKLLIDEVYPSHDLDLLHLLVAAMLGLGISSSLLAAVRANFTAGVRARLAGDVRLRFFDHLQRLPMRFFDTHQVGEVTSRLAEAGRGVESVGRTVDVVLTQGLFLLLVPPMLLVLDWRLGLLALVVVPPVALVVAKVSRRLRDRWQVSSETAAELAAFQVEVLGRIRTFKSFGLEGRVRREAESKVADAVESQLRAIGAAQWLGGLNGTMRTVCTALLTLVGWRFILSGGMTLGDYVAFSAYVGYLYGPVFTLFQTVSDVQLAGVDLGRMYEYLDLPAEEEAGAPGRLAGAAALPDLRRGPVAYRLRGVGFGYQPDRPVLLDVDLDLAAGEVVAVVGPSGSGKTTLLRLLAGLERPTRGEIWMAGRAAGELPVSVLRAPVATVWQDGGLVRGSLWRNLTLAMEQEPPREAIDRVVEACGLAELVAELPAGYDTEVAEGGGSLSAGQQQRVAIARALLRDAPVLLLDEATANLDLDTERRILEGLLATCRGGRTLVYVTHRPATAELADRVVALAAGRLREQRARPRPVARAAVTGGPA